MYSSSQDNPQRYQRLLPTENPQLVYEIRSSSATSRAPPLSKRTTARAACEACRRSKIRCTGARPKCRNCDQGSIECHYVTKSAETRSQAVKRQLRELRHQQNQTNPHAELIQLFRSMKGEEVRKILPRLQAGEDVETLLSFLKVGDLLLQLRTVPESRLRYDLPYGRNMPAVLLSSSSPYFGSLIYQATWSHSEDHSATAKYQSNYLKPYHVATFFEPLLDNTKPSMWTNVSKDDDLMRGLLSAYFSREYHLFPVFHKDYFLQDMASGWTDCCSSLLVNTILAYSFPLSDDTYWNPQSLSYLFLAEAKRLWEIEIMSDRYRSLTSIQALVIINVIHNNAGLDRIGDVYGKQAFTLAKEIKLMDGNAHILSRRLRDAYNYSAWGVFNADSLISWQYLHQPVFSYPPRVCLPDPVVRPDWYSEFWIRYPQDQQLTTSQWGFYFKALSNFNNIVNAACGVTFGANVSMTNTQAQALGKRLVAWYKSLPSCLDPTNMVLPSHFLLHFEYHTFTMTLYQSFREDTWDEGFKPGDAYRHAECSLQILIRLYYVRHSFESTDVYLVSPLSRLGFVCLERMQESPSAQDLEDLRSTLALVLIGLSSQSRRAGIVRAVTKIVRNSLPLKELQHIESKENVSDFQADGGFFEVQEEVLSSWIPSVVSISDDHRTKQLSVLAEQTLNSLQLQ